MLSEKEIIKSDDFNTEMRQESFCGRTVPEFRIHDETATTTGNRTRLIEFVDSPRQTNNSMDLNEQP